MPTSKSFARLLSVLATSAALAACSGASSSPSLAPGSSARAEGPKGLARTSIAIRPFAIHPDRAKTWVSPDIKNLPRLLFESDSARATVDIFALPSMKLKGTVTGFSRPQGECSDKNGNVWVTDSDSQQIVQLSRSGSVMNTLSDPSGYPVGCAIDPTTGNLAVMNIYDFSFSPGEVLIYANASGGPVAIANPNQNTYFLGGYDNSGNLFVDGQGSSSENFMLSECPAGGSSCSTIGISGGNINYPGMVQWYAPGGYLAVGDQSCGQYNDYGNQGSCIYAVSLSGSAGTITGTTDLSNPDGGAVCDLVQGVIAANATKYLAGGDYEYCRDSESSVDRWAYPAGGSPMNGNNDDVRGPTGAAISTK